MTEKEKMLAQAALMKKLLGKTKGAFCIGGFHTAGHPIDYERRNQGLEYAYPITVGDNVWIGAGVQVMPGVTIGSDVVIGGGSVVTKDIPDHSVAYGNPCKVVRKITDADRERCWDITRPVSHPDGRTRQGHPADPNCDSQASNGR